MTRDSEPHGQIGGISAMISQQDVCPQCGEPHPESVFGLRHASRGCPNVLMGAFPIMTPREPSRAASAVQRALGAEQDLPHAPRTLLGEPKLFLSPHKPVPRLAIPWPMPSETDEFL
ncbi:MAG TPA: hypothetical protein VMH90_04375 [Thermoplasmata archaeon]|nr:hypothetical protein [Thermoplasmata archaeon]